MTGGDKMTKLLEKAFKKASELPDVEQNVIGRWLLEELESERKWDRAFAESEDILVRLADEAIEAKNKGEIKSLDLDRL